MKGQTPLGLWDDGVRTVYRGREAKLLRELAATFADIRATRARVGKVEIDFSDLKVQAHFRKTYPPMREEPGAVAV
jgi:hypothetical protein